MKKLIRGLAVVAFAALFTGCLQNLKDSELIVENSTAGSLRFDFRGEKFDIASGGSATINKVDPNTYGYTILVSDIPAILGGVTITKAEAGELNGELEFAQKGWRVRMNVVGTVTDAKKDTTVATGMSGTYKVETLSTGGWID